MNGNEVQDKARRMDGWRKKRAAKRALKADSAEKQGERKRHGDEPSVADNASRAGVGGFISGGF